LQPKVEFLSSLYSCNSFTWQGKGASIDNGYQIQHDKIISSLSFFSYRALKPALY
jgi:hypothetical protein